MMRSFYSLTTVPVRTYTANGTPLSTATAFFYQEDEGKAYLVTNWHVVTGRHPDNPSVSMSGAVPAYMEMTLHPIVDGKKIQLSRVERERVELNSDDGENPTWFEHPTRRFKVDVVVLELSTELNTRYQFNYLMQSRDLETRFEPAPMDDVFVIGYPWGLTGGSEVLPLFKRGSIASEPAVPIRQLPRFLIDCRTASAMSGSPVIASRSGIWQPPGGSQGDTVIGRTENFTGVYSGRFRIFDLEEEEQKNPNIDKTSEIGIVWRPEVVPEIIEGHAPGTKLSAFSS